MKVNYTGRHMELTEPLKQFTKERLDKMATYLDEYLADCGDDECEWD